MVDQVFQVKSTKQFSFDILFYRIDKINGWLSKLEDQIQKDEFDVKDFKFTTKGKGNKTKTLIEDICTKLNNKKAEMIKEVDTEKKYVNLYICTFFITQCLSIRTKMHVHEIISE